MSKKAAVEAVIEMAYRMYFIIFDSKRGDINGDMGHRNFLR